MTPDRRRTMGDGTTTSAEQWVHRLDGLDAAESVVDGDGDAVRGLLGGKGANLAGMTRLGVPVPPTC